MQITSTNTLIALVEQWAEERGLLNPDNKHPQALKMVEEVGELAGALLRKNEAKTRDGIGDVAVTLIILAQQCGWSLQECLQDAYDEIAGRTGETRDGVFIKSADL